MVGLPCSGKTTLAKEIEKEYSALRLTPDEWHIQLGHEFGYGMDEAKEQLHNERHDAIEALMLSMATRVLILGVDVILDYGFWSKQERDEFKLFAKNLGVDVKIHYKDITEEELFKRLRNRNQQLPEGSYMIPKQKLKEWMQFFEPPQDDESN